jgi:hypothetical protein
MSGACWSPTGAVNNTCIFKLNNSFEVLGLELRAFTLSHSSSPIFCDRVFFKIRSQEPFALAGFEL